MTEWETSIARGFSVGIGIMSCIILVNAVLIGLAISHPLGIGTFIVGLAVLSGLALAGLVGYWVYGMAGSKYLLDRNALVIRWGPAKQVIPANKIERVFVGDEIENPIQFRGGMWPGHWVGYGEITGMGQALFYATVPPKKQIYVATPGLIYGISPADREDFLASLHRRLQMGPTQTVEQSSRRPSILDWAIWRDWLGVALSVANVLLLLALIGLLCFHFPSLPLLIPLHFGAGGTPDRFGPRGQIFIIPAIGLLTLLFNGALGGLMYSRERVASYLLWGGALLIQMLVWTAAVGVLGHL